MTIIILGIKLKFYLIVSSNSCVFRIAGGDDFKKLLIDVFL